MKPYLRLRTQIVLLLSMLTLVSLACGATLAPVDTKPADMTEKIAHVTEAPRQMFVCKTDPAHGLNLRVDAGTGFESLGVYPNGTLVTLTGGIKQPVVIDWYSVEIDGVKGWASSNYLCEVK